MNSYACLIMFTHSKDYLNSNSKLSFSILKITLKNISKNFILRFRVFCHVVLKYSGCLFKQMLMNILFVRSYKLKDNIASCTTTMIFVGLLNQGVSVEAVDPVFQAKMLDMLKQTGR